jgi:hypothetical protein
MLQMISNGAPIKQLVDLTPTPSQKIHEGFTQLPLEPVLDRDTESSFGPVDILPTVGAFGLTPITYRYCLIYASKTAVFRP